MREIFKFAALHLTLVYRRWQLASARAFRASLEVTIVHERIRAQRLVDENEHLERQAAMAIVAARSEKRIPENAATR